MGVQSGERDRVGRKWAVPRSVAVHQGRWDELDDNPAVSNRRPEVVPPVQLDAPDIPDLRAVARSLVEDHPVQSGAPDRLDLPGAAKLWGVERAG